MGTHKGNNITITFMRRFWEKNSYKGCVRVILKNNKKSFFARSGLKKMAENHHFSVRVFIK